MTEIFATNADCLMAPGELYDGQPIDLSRFPGSGEYEAAEVLGETNERACAADGCTITPEILAAYGRTQPGDPNEAAAIAALRDSVPQGCFYRILLDSRE
jgi:hypothetical protein